MTFTYDAATMRLVSDTATAQLRRSLNDETWGDRLARARAASRIGLRGAAELISEQVMPISFTSLSRLEDLVAPPGDIRKRILATLAAVAYGYAPEVFGLSLDDIPRSVDIDEFVRRASERHASDDPQPNTRSGKGKPSSRWGEQRIAAFSELSGTTRLSA